MTRRLSLWNMPVVALLTSACADAPARCADGRSAETTGPSKHLTQSRFSAAPPFEQPEPLVAVANDGSSVTPPASIHSPWYIVARASRTGPPRWRAIEATEAGQLDMPENTSWRCIYNPTTADFTDPSGNMLYDMTTGRPVRPLTVADGSWIVYRAVFCSNDDWRTSAHVTSTYILNQSGRAEGQGQLELYLADPNSELAVLLSSAKPHGTP